MDTKDGREFWRKHLQVNTPPLDQGTRIWEIVCGLLMVLTFTGSINAAMPGQEEIKVILWAALGCNTAWGIVDTLMYLISVLVERNNALKALKIARAGSSAESLEAIKEYLPPIIASAVTENQLQEIKNELIRLPEPPARAYLVARDVKNAIEVFLQVFLSTFPAVIPFLFEIDLYRAMRISNGIVLIVLFLCGFILGGQSGYRRIRFGLGLAFIGAVLVAIIMALGG